MCDFDYLTLIKSCITHTKIFTQTRSTRAHKHQHPHLHTDTHTNKQSKGGRKTRYRRQTAMDFFPPPAPETIMVTNGSTARQNTHTHTSYKHTYNNTLSQFGYSLAWLFSGLIISPWLIHLIPSGPAYYLPAHAAFSSSVSCGSATYLPVQVSYIPVHSLSPVCIILPGENSPIPSKWCNFRYKFFKFRARCQVFISCR